MILFKAVTAIGINFILYASFGSFICIRKKGRWDLPLAVAIGFFAYYALFALFCIPIMFTYRPLSLLAKLWLVPCIIAPVLSAVLFRREWRDKIAGTVADIGAHILFWGIVCAVAAVSVILTATTYNFTLDAAYYVANVTTNVDTNMINVYDAFTGSWQDHFELRYVFATYYALDSAVCYLTGIPALVQTKIVMSATVCIIVNMLYVYICTRMFEHYGQRTVMFIFMTAVNYLFISIYTTSNFLMTRTYEGKTIVGNVSIILIFILFMRMVDDEKEGLFIMLFVAALGTATVSSTANMVVPAQVCVLFAPYALLHKKPGILPRIFVCILPELVMMVLYVLYVKGYYAVYTFPI